MTPKRIEALDTTLQKTYEWLHDIRVEIGIENRHAYLALRGTLHAIRDFLPLDESAQFAAQLPMVVRGLYFEGWDPSRTPEPDRTREAFLRRVETELEHAMWDEEYPIDAEAAARAVLRILSDRISGGEMLQVARAMPKPVREFWPALSAVD